MRPYTKEHATSAQKFFLRIGYWGSSDASGGILLIAFTLIALAWINSPWGDGYQQVWQTELSFRIGNSAISKPLHDWINDGLMFFFFLLVGLDIKREVLVGELRSLKKAVLPGVAAVAGMVFPAGIYMAFNRGGPAFRGWGVPMATDIVFAMGLLALFGSNLPRGLRVFLVSLAIADDIGGIIVIAAFYSSGISAPALVAAAIILALLIAANLAGFRHPFSYYFLGFLLWAAFLESGIHPVIAGVLLAATVPIRSRIDCDSFLKAGRSLMDQFADTPGGCDVVTNEKQQELIEELLAATRFVDTPLRRMEHTLRPWVFLLILPVFALANAGVRFSADFLDSLVHPAGLGIITGLLAGKQAGILLSVWIMTKTGFARLPAKVTLSQIYAAAWLAGIGFTVSFFIADLAFAGSPEEKIAKEAVLTASFLASVGGFAMLRFVGRRRPDNTIQQCREEVPGIPRH